MKSHLPFKSNESLVIEALSSLASYYGELLDKFKYVFEKRHYELPNLPGTARMLEKAPRKVEALNKTISKLLIEIPTRVPFEQLYPKGKFEDRDFLRDMEEAIKSIAEHSPQTLELLISYQLKSKKPLTEVFGTLFIVYLNNTVFLY